MSDAVVVPDRVNAPAVEGAGESLIAERRLRGAQIVARAVLIACAISAPFCVGIVFLLDRWLGLAMLGIAAATGAYEATILVLLARGRYHRRLDWIGAAIEVSIPTVIALIDASRIGPAYALTSAPVMLYGLAVLGSALRLRPALVLFAGGLGAAQMVVLYIVLGVGIDPTLVAQLPSLGASNILQRAAYVLLAGIVGWLLCRSLLGLARDLSAQLVARDRAERERQVLEERLHQAQKMEAIGQLAGGVAHDFNNLLTTILGHAEFLEEEVTDPELHEDAVQIRRAGKRAAELTGQLLAFSRKQTFQPRSVDLNALVADASRMLERLVGEGVAVRFVPGDELPYVEVDPNRLEQVLVNLVVNARDAMPQGGTVTLETARPPEDMGVPSPGEHGWVMLSVADTGTGMAPEVQARLFEPFFTTKARGKGTGLGLATAYGIVQQCGGHLLVESTPGEGSTFRVLLPGVDVAPQSLAPASVLPALGGHETVLVVEDERALREFAARVLRRAGYDVLSAEDAPAALALSREHPSPIELLLTDVVMPGPSGKELWDELEPERPQTRVLFMSGYAENILGEQVALGPDTPLLSKPFSAEQLLGRVRDVLDRR